PFGARTDVTALAIFEAGLLRPETPDDPNLSADDHDPFNTLMVKGFTGHEHMEGLGLIHMNGRVYDTKTARFISADPMIQAPKDSQSFNRYAYECRA
ncbi:MAG: RHS repeat domain-containing protein, partial [Panacagrimonas sp.]